MNEALKKEKNLNKSSDEGLDISPKLSHNRGLSDISMVEFVKLLARYAAESDYAYLSLYRNKGGQDHDAES